MIDFIDLFIEDACGGSSPHPQASGKRLWIWLGFYLDLASLGTVFLFFFYDVKRSGACGGSIFNDSGVLLALWGHLGNNGHPDFQRNQNGNNKSFQFLHNFGVILRSWGHQKSHRIFVVF